MLYHDCMTAREANPTTGTTHELCTNNMDMARHEARAMSRQTPDHVDLDTLTSVAYEALVTSANRYNPNLGIPYRAYAKRRVRGALLDHLRSDDWASRRVRRAIRHRDTTRDQLTATNGHTPTHAELAAAMNVTPAQLAKTEREHHQGVVLRIEQVSEVFGVEALPTTGTTPEQVIEQRELHAYLRDAIATLPKRLRTVIHGSYYENRTIEDMAAELGVTESRISQLRKEAETLIRDALGHHLGIVTTSDKPIRKDVKQRRDTYRAAVTNRTPWRHRLNPTE